MTADYDLFVRELNATGREYGEGFSIPNLMRLTGDERVNARDALRVCVERGETRAPLPLIVVDAGPETLALLRGLLHAALRKRSPGEFDVAVAEALAYRVVDPEALDFLERAVVRDSEGWVSGMAVEGLIKAGEGCDASTRLARLVVAPDNERWLDTCAYGLLERHGWRIEYSATQKETLALLDAMVDGDAIARDAALTKVLQAPVRPWPWVSEPG